MTTIEGVSSRMTAAKRPPSRFRMYGPEHDFHIPEQVARIHRHLQKKLASENLHYEWRMVRRGQVLIPARSVQEVPLLAAADYIELTASRERRNGSS